MKELSHSSAAFVNINLDYKEEYRPENLCDVNIKTELE